VIATVSSTTGKITLKCVSLICQKYMKV
jgi:hypothetical protein